ncbi:hypothetical protein ACOME3_003422 [Neoechinorhynchus agilis]
MAEQVEECVKRLLIEDKDMVISLEVSRLISRVIKERKYHVHYRSVRVLNNLKVKEVADRYNAQKAAKLSYQERFGSKSRKERKILKEEQKLKAELDIESAAQRRQHVLSQNTLIIEQLFYIYFRILRTANQEPIPHELLSEVLCGVEKYGHLINIEMFDDLLECLYDVANSEHTTQTNIFRCLIAIFVVNSHQLELVAVDLSRFYAVLYKILRSLDIEGDKVQKCLSKKILPLPEIPMNK